MKVRNSAARCKRGVALILARWELQILSPYQLGILNAIEATHAEMAPTDILKVIDKKRVDQRPPAAPTISSDCALSFSETGTPKRAATCAMKRISGGAVSSILAFSGDRWESAATLGPALRNTHSYGNRRQCGREHGRG
jgi:hypothetical protein